MESTLQITLQSLLAEGSRVMRHERNVLFLVGESGIVLWDTKNDCQIGGETYWEVTPFPRNRYFLVTKSLGSYEDRYSGVLNTKTGDLFISRTYKKITHLRRQYFSVETHNEDTVVLDVESGEVTPGKAVMIGKHAIINGEKIINLSNGKLVFSTNKGIEHLFGPYFLIGTSYKETDKRVLHLNTGNLCSVPHVEGATASLKHIGGGKLLIEYRVPWPKKRKHAILTFSTGKITPVV